MSFEMLREAYRRVRARAPKGTGPLSRADVYPFVSAAGEFGDALAGAGLYAALKKEAERFVDWVGHVAESNRDFSFQKEGWYLPFTANREVGFTYILAPIISETYMGYVEYHDAHFDTEPKASEGLGHYLLYVCSIAREAEMQEPHFFEHLVDACLLVGEKWHVPPILLATQIAIGFMNPVHEPLGLLLQCSVQARTDQRVPDFAGGGDEWVDVRP